MTLAVRTSLRPPARRFARLALVCLTAVALPAQPPSVPPQQAIESLPSPAIWYGHLAHELMPFWRSPAAQGNPVGVFPSTLCNDATAVDFRNPCAEVARNAWLRQPMRYLVPQSRQIYAYGAAFHVTGDPWYLDLMKAGVQELRRTMIDRQRGGMFTQQNLTTGAWGPRMELRNPQELAYGLLGLGFYYYLTRDPEVLPEILSVRDHILGRYFNYETGVLQWTLEDTPTEPAAQYRLVATLDQMNAYMVLLTPILPEPFRSEWKGNLAWLSNVMRTRFYSESENLMFLQANRPEDLDLTKNGTDFGHTIKAFWMTRFAARINGDKAMESWAAENGLRVLGRAYHPESGSWMSGLGPGGTLDLNKSWWIYCELDQFAATMALEHPEAAIYLPSTYDYWFARFVDRPAGEVWSNVDGMTHLPPPDDMPKAWPWKNGYHSMEHALVAFITTSQLQKHPVRLFYAFQKMPPQEEIQPYFFQGEIESVERLSDRKTGDLQAVTFRSIR